MKTRFIILVLSIFLSACDSAPTKHASSKKINQIQLPAKKYLSQAKIPAKEHLKLAESAMARVNTNYQLADVNLAIFHYENALEEHQDNIFIQQAHYRALFVRDYVEHGFATKDLQQSYDELSWLAKKGLNPPSYVNFITASKKPTSLTALISILLDVISDQPNNANLWNTLSELYEGTETYWLAVAAAKRAHQLDTENPEYMYQLGDSINDIIQLQECNFDEKDYAISAVKHISKAAAKNPIQLYIDNTGLHYMNLGLFPLAYQSSKKAYDLEKNEWTIIHYLEASLLMRRYDEAEIAANDYIAKINKEDVLEDLAMISVSKNQWQEAANYMKKNIHSSNNILVELRTRWIHSLAQADYTDKDLYLIDSKSPWEDSVREFMRPLKEEERLAYESDYLLEKAANGCQLTEAYFYTAYWHWKKNNGTEAKRFLQITQKQTATRFTEYMWAGILENKL